MTKNIFVIFTAAIGFTICNLNTAQASTALRCEDNRNLSGTEVNVNASGALAIGSASWDGPGDSGGVLSNVELRVISDGANLRFYAQNRSRSFDLIVYGAAESVTTSRIYNGYFVGTQSGSAPVSIGVTCELLDNQTQ